MLDFLNSVTVSDVAENQKAPRTGVRKQRNPEKGLTIRVWKDGSVYPSQELVDQFGLEYGPKDADYGYGFDIVDTALYDKLSTPRRILFISPVKRTAGKVDIFSSVGYDENGKPRTTIMEQGAATYGKDSLIPSLEEIYGLGFQTKENENGSEYVDMVLVPNPLTGKPWSLPAGKLITYLPKKVSRGEAKGEIMTQRREDPKFWAFLPLAMLDGGESTESAEPAKQEAQPELPFHPEEPSAPTANGAGVPDTTTDPSNPFMRMDLPAGPGSAVAEENAQPIEAVDSNPFSKES